MIADKARMVLIGSVALNIFLAAFVIGRMGAMDMMPPPPEMAGPGMPPPPPPMFGPARLFSKEEMRDNMKAMKQSFDEVRKLREDFAKKLAAGPVSKEDVAKHFADVEAILNKVRTQTQDKIAEKISSLSKEDRERVAKQMEFADMPPYRGHGRFPQGRFAPPAGAKGEAPMPDQQPAAGGVTPPAPAPAPAAAADAPAQQ